MNELIKNYQNNCDEWNSLYAEAQENARNFDKKIWEIKDKYQEQISEIERKMYSEVYKVEQEKEINEKEMKNKRDIVGEKLNQARDLFKLIHLHVIGSKVETPIVYTYDRRNKTIHNPIMTIREDNYCKAYLYIITNDKPVNKFSLIMVGSCPILEPDRDTRNPLYSYGIKAHTEERCHIMTNIKDDYTEDYLREYAEKNIKRLLKRLSSIDDLTLRYQQAIDIFNTTEGKIAYYQWRKYYYENHYSNGTATPEYKDVLKKLKQLKKELKRQHEQKEAAKEKLFCGYYPEGFVYADKTREEHGDYKKLAFLSFKTLKLEFYGIVPADLKELITEDAAAIQAKKGEQIATSTVGNMVTLGWGL